MVHLQTQQIPSQQVSYSCERSMSAMCIKYVHIHIIHTSASIKYIIEYRSYIRVECECVCDRYTHALAPTHTVQHTHAHNHTDPSYIYIFC